MSVVLVYLKKIASDDDAVELWATPTQERPIDDLLEDPNLPAVRDALENKQRFYDEANKHMLLAFQHARKAATFLDANNISTSGGSDYSAILSNAFRSTTGHSRAEFLRMHRKDAWLSVFSMMQFHKWLDKKQTDELIRDVSQDSRSHFPFTVENIKATLANIVLQRQKLFEQSAWNVFEELTKYFKGNTNHTEGWKSNDGFKVNRKLVFPLAYPDRKTSVFITVDVQLWRTIDFYNDLDRVLAILDGRDFVHIRRIGDAIDRAIHADRNTPQTIESTYFQIRYFKKGTVHLKWKRYDLLEKFSLTAGAGRNWLRPEPAGKGDGGNGEADPNGETALACA